MRNEVSTGRRLLALCAGAALMLMDYLLVGGMFIYQPAGGEAFIVVLTCCMVAALAFQRRWLLFTAQNLVTALAVLRVAQMTDPVEVKELVPIASALACGNVFAWLVTRAFRS